MTQPIFNKSEQDERRYLEEIKQKLQSAIDDAEVAASAIQKDSEESMEYMWEHKDGMDRMEKLAVRKSIAQIALIGESVVAKKKRIAKLIASPYFGRVDFRENGSMSPEPIYIGIHSFYDQQENQNLIHDWRAPISGMFYDFELGKAGYDAPSGTIKGEITLKRQYNIRRGKMEFMLESALNIHDDILQQELSRNSSEKMKNIVATIQRDQNAIIRNEDSKTLIIQGVAGSGKTSIALHRIAFLLYRFKDKIKSEDILIISPNKVFADYISNVLPELGEEKIRETGMEELARALLENKYKFQTFIEQVSQLMVKNDEQYQERIRFKSGFDFINRLNEFLVYVENGYFRPALFMVKRFPIPVSYLEEKYLACQRLPLKTRITQMTNAIVNDLNFYYRHEVNAAEKIQIRREIEKMFPPLNLKQLYISFYEWLGKPEMLKQAGSRYEYADVFPLIYLKIGLEGVKIFEKVKHLVIDEMQDYTPLQYRVLAKVFPCNKTILGDSNQSINPFSSSDAEVIGKIFPQADVVRMMMSYRSTWEIAEFSRQILANPKMKVIERHGEKPTLKHCSSEKEELAEIRKMIAAFEQSTFRSLGIICKTQPQADMLYEAVKASHKRLYVLNSQSFTFMEGVIVSSAHMAKGLEFDQVIIPFATAQNYTTDTDRQMLYVAATRAMHKLDLTFTREKSELLNNGNS